MLNIYVPALPIVVDPIDLQTAAVWQADFLYTRREVDLYSDFCPPGLLYTRRETAANADLCLLADVL